MKRLCRTFLAMLGGGVIGVLFTPQAQAVPINGHITFAGTVTLDTSSAGTATAVTAWHFVGNVGTPHVASADGDFASTEGSSATFSAPWSFNTVATITNFWSVGGFSFDLTISSIVIQGFYLNGNGYVVVSGSGIVHGNGFDETAGTWSFTTQDPKAGGVFSFSAAAGSVPDGGSTVALLGATLVGVEGVRRLLARRSA